MNLVPLETLELFRGTLMARLQQDEVSYSIDLDHPDFGFAFRWYLLFTHAADLIAGICPDDVFYNRYFWFRRFANLHRFSHGVDAGIDQQVCQLLEQTEVSIDWSTIEQIDQLAKSNL